MHNNAVDVEGTAYGKLVLPLLARSITLLCQIVVGLSENGVILKIAQFFHVPIAYWNWKAAHSVIILLSS